MFKSCNKCGSIHDHNYTCYKTLRKKELTIANKFRNTNRWATKSLAIRQRDNYLCQVCLAGIYTTTAVYNYNKLEVHHIESLEDSYHLRLDDDNLITLCSYHHKLAEEGSISKDILRLLTKPKYSIDKLRELIK